jgi:hypothetical protein
MADPMAAIAIIINLLSRNPLVPEIDRLLVLTVVRYRLVLFNEAICSLPGSN